MVTGFRGSPLAEPFRSPAAGAKPSNSDMLTSLAGRSQALTSLVRARGLQTAE